MRKTSLHQDSSRQACAQCSASFEITDEDLAFLEKLSPTIGGKTYPLPPPTLCPLCRQKRRISWRNERNLYKRKCKLCGREHVSIYSPDKDLHVLCADCWWSDKWNGLQYGREFNFNRPFFDQFGELLHKAGLISFFGRNNENSEYVNQETDDKNCYMNAGGHYNEDCYYCTYSLWGKDNVDCYWVVHSELCYECIHCENCNSCTGCEDCNQCTDCLYCEECTGCSNCLGCYGLKHKEYHFFNEPLDAGGYKKQLEDFHGSHRLLVAAKKKAQEHFNTFPHRAAVVIHSEDSTGNYLMECRNVQHGYLYEKGHDLRYAYIGLDVKDSMDLSCYGWGELNYEVGSSLENHSAAFLSSVINCNESYLCFVCQNSDHLFGCIGLQRKKHCILNKQYSEEEYKELVRKIIEHMEKTGEWGQFFPTSISPWGYNETVASEYFPLSREEALRRRWKWKEDDPKEFVKQTYRVPDRIDDVQDDIVDAVLACEATGRNYRITKQELAFYRRREIPIPRKHPHRRHLERLSLQNPWRMWERRCHKCGKEIQTTYQPSRPEVVYCEQCYLEVVY